MLTDPVAIVLLLITGILALIVGILSLKAFIDEKRIHHVFWAISFLVLFVSGVLIIALDFSVLQQPLVPVVASLIPIGLAVGAYAGTWPDKKYWQIYGLYSLIMLGVLTVVQVTSMMSNFKAMFIMLIHVPAGLSIILIPIIAIYQNELEKHAIFYSIGGLLISFGGVLLAGVSMSGTGSFMGFITLPFIFSVLPLVLLLMTICYALGILLAQKWSISNSLALKVLSIRKTP